MDIVRALVLKCLQLNLVLKAEHIADNKICDMLSRFQNSRFHLFIPEAKQDPEIVPHHLWEIFKMKSSNL